MSHDTTVGGRRYLAQGAGPEHLGQVSLVADESAAGDQLARMFASRGFDVTAHLAGTSPESAPELTGVIALQAYDVVVTCLATEAQSSFVRAINGRGNAPLIMLDSYASKRLMFANMTEILPVPWHPDTLVGAVHNAIEAARQRQSPEQET